MSNFNTPFDVSPPPYGEYSEEERSQDGNTSFNNSRAEANDAKGKGQGVISARPQSDHRGGLPTDQETECYRRDLEMVTSSYDLQMNNRDREQEFIRRTNLFQKMETFYRKWKSVSRQLIEEEIKAQEDKWLEPQRTKVNEEREQLDREIEELQSYLDKHCLARSTSRELGQLMKRLQTNENAHLFFEFPEIGSTELHLDRLIALLPEEKQLHLKTTRLQNAQRRQDQQNRDELLRPSPEGKETRHIPSQLTRENPFERLLKSLDVMSTNFLRNRGVMEPRRPKEPQSRFEDHVEDQLERAEERGELTAGSVRKAIVLGAINSSSTVQGVKKLLRINRNSKPERSLGKRVCSRATFCSVYEPYARSLQHRRECACRSA